MLPQGYVPINRMHGLPGGSTAEIGHDDLYRLVLGDKAGKVVHDRRNGLLSVYNSVAVPVIPADHVV